MNSEPATPADSSIESVTLVIVLLVCAVVPFVTFPKLYLDEMGDVSIFDYFVNCKWIANNVLAVVAFAALACLKRTAVKIKPTLLLFTLWAAVSTCFATDFHDAMFGDVIKRQGLLAYLGFFLFYSLVSTSFNFRHIGSVVYVTLAGSALMAMLCVSELFGVDIIRVVFGAPDYYSFSTVVHATFGNSNYVGSFFSLMVPLAMVTYLRSKNSRQSILLLPLAVAGYAGLLVSGSRISWISVFISVAFCVFFLEKNRVFLYKSIAIAVLGLAVTVGLNATHGSVVKGKYADFIEQVEVSATRDVRSFGSGRVYAYEKFMLLALSSGKHALVGVGPNCLSYYGTTSHEDAKKYPFLQEGRTFANAHSDLVEYAASMGIPSLVCYLGFILSILVPWFRKLHTATPEMSGIFAGWLGYLGQSCFNTPIIGVVTIFFVFSAIIDRDPYD